MRHVVDGVEVTLGLRQPGATAGLVLPADDAELRHATAVDTETDVPDVVVAGPDDLAEDGLVARQQGAGAARQLRRGEARGRAAGTVGLDGLGVGVEVELVGLVDEDHVDAQVVVVDLVDPVHQGDLLRQDVRAPEVAGVGLVGQEREPVGALDDDATRPFADGRGALGGVELDLVQVGLDQLLLRRRQGGAEVGDVEAVVAVVGRVDVPEAPGPRTAAWKPIRVTSRRIVAPVSATLLPAKVLISGCFAASSGSMTGESTTSKATRSPLGAGTLTVTARLSVAPASTLSRAEASSS